MAADQGAAELRVNVCVRHARPSDAVLLAGIEQAVSPSPWSESQFQSVCAGENIALGRALVAEQTGRLAGFAVCQLVLDQGSLQSIAVAPAHHRQGIGRTLIIAVLSELRTGGAVNCLLEVRASNTAAIDLYRSLGFRKDGVRRAYYPSQTGREDALLMSLLLDNRSIGE